MTLLWVKVGGLWPVNTGGRIRSFHILSELSRHHQQIAGKLASVDANDLRYQLSFRRTRQAIEFQQDYTTNLQPLANDQLAKIAILRDEDAVIAICLIQDVFI